MLSLMVDDGEVFRWMVRVFFIVLQSSCQHPPSTVSGRVMVSELYFGQFAAREKGNDLPRSAQ
jgi:hypothetical protein